MISTETVLYICATVIILVIFVFAYSLWYILWVNDFPNKRRSFSSKKSLKGKTALITGANAGLGYETAMDFAKRGARVIMVCRNKKKADIAKTRLIAESGNNNIIVMQCDLADLESVQNFCKKYLAQEKALHILINNAGLGFPQGFTKQKFDYLVGTNYVGHFLLTHLLLNLMKKSAPSRIINVSSCMSHTCHELGLKLVDDTTGTKLPGMAGYPASKLLNIMHTRELAKKLKDRNVTAYSVHPGYIFNGAFVNQLSRLNPKYIFLAMFNYFSLTLEEGARTTLYCALQDSIEDKSGEYFDNCRMKVPNKLALDEKLCEQVWNVTMEAIKDYTKQGAE